MTSEQLVTRVFRSTAVVGAGAVGCFFGGMLALAGMHVTLIGRAAHVQAIAHQGLRLDRSGSVTSIPVAASEDLAAVRGADLVLMCVKSTDTDAAARAIAPHVAPEAVVLSLQNGVENPTVIARHMAQQVVPAVVYVATAMAGPGIVKHFGRGDLVIGSLAGGVDDESVAASLRGIVACFGAATVPVTVSTNVMGELWSKLLVNCAYNAASALAQATYARMAALPEVREVQASVVREVVALAAAEGVPLSLDESMRAVAAIATAMPGQHSSTAQDMARRKLSEIDHLNGFVARRGRELGVPTPVNQTLHAMVKLVEAGYAD